MSWILKPERKKASYAFLILFLVGGGFWYALDKDLFSILGITKENYHRDVAPAAPAGFVLGSATTSSGTESDDFSVVNDTATSTVSVDSVPQATKNIIQYRTDPNAITRSEFNSGMSALNESLQATLSSALHASATSTPSYFQGFMQTVYKMIADSQRIDYLPSVTMSSPTITGTPSIAGYLRTSGGSLSGDFSALNITASGGMIADTLGVGTSTPSDTMALNGALYFAPISAPSVTTDRLYNVGSNLYFGGALVGGAVVGTWSLSGSDVYRDSGNVGIGTTTPLGRVNIVGSNYASSLLQQYRASSDASPPTFIMDKSEGTPDSPSALISGDNTGLINARGWQNGGFRDNARIRFLVDGTPASNFVPGRIQLETSDGTAVPAIRLTVRPTGNVGISTTSPWAILSVNGTSTQSSYIPLFAVASSTAAGATAFIIDSNGNVGIGTTSPQTRLQIVQSDGVSNIQFSPTSAYDPSLMFYRNTTNLVGIGRINWSAPNSIGAETTYSFIQGVIASSTAGFEVGGIQFYTGGYGSGSMMFKGNSLGIGTSTPWAMLSVSTTTTNTLGTPLFTAATSSGATAFIIDSNGKVGIGTSSPLDTLSIQLSGGAAYPVGYYTSTGSLQGQILTGSDTSRQIGFNLTGTSGDTLRSDHWVVFRYNSAVNKIFIGDTGTNSWFESSHDLNFYSGNAVPSTSTAPWMTIATTGNVGIGTTSPWATLSVNGTSTQSSYIPLFAVASSTSVNSTVFVIDSTGKVGIGTSSPTDKLTVAFMGENVGQEMNGLKLYKNTTGNIILNLAQESLSGSSVIRLDKSRAGPSLIDAADTIGRLDFRGYDGTAYRTAASIRAGIDGTPGASDIPGWLAFYTAADGGITTSEQMRINNAGYIGIGTTSPYSMLSISNSRTTAANTPLFTLASTTDGTATTTALTVLASGNIAIGTTTASYIVHVQKDQNAKTRVLVQNNDSGASARAGFQAIAGTGQQNIVMETYGENVAAPLNGSSMLYTAGYTNKLFFGTVGTPRMVLDPSGRFGIGTTSPSAMLSLTASSTIDLGGIYIAGAAGATSNLFNISTTTSGSITSTAFIIDGNGKVGIGTSTPWAALSVSGVVSFASLRGSVGAGSLCLTAGNEVVYNAGSDACLSSLRVTKHDISDLSLDALSLVDQLNPVSFVYNEGDGRTRYGFIAEDVSTLDDHLATHDASGKISGIDDRAILSITIKAIQELNDILQISTSTTSTTTSWVISTRLDSIEDRLATLEQKSASSTFSNIANWVGDSLTAAAANFKDLISDHITVNNLDAINIVTQTIKTNKLCVGDICVTKDQFMSVFAGSGTTTPQDSSSSPLVSDTPVSSIHPSITLLGNNPASITLGTSYVDLGAVASTSDGAALMPDLFSNNVDTSVAGTYEVIWRVHDSQMLWATSTRVVIVSSPTVTDPAPVVIPADAGIQASSTPADSSSSSDILISDIPVSSSSPSSSSILEASSTPVTEEASTSEGILPY